MAKYLLASSSTFDSTFDETFTVPGTRRRGSIGGATFQKIGSVYCIRHRSVPTDKKRERQTAQRQRFDVFQKFWRTLDSMEKQSFSDEAPSFPRTDSLGNVYEISGINLQQSSNTFLHAADQPPITEAKPPAVFPNFTIVSLQITIDTQDFDLVTNPAIVPAGYSMFIYATRPVSPAQLTPTTTFFLLGVLPAGSNTTMINPYATYEDMVGSLSSSAGLVVGVSLQLLDLDTGQPGTTVYSLSPPILQS